MTNINISENSIMPGEGFGFQDVTSLFERASEGGWLCDPNPVLSLIPIKMIFQSSIQIQSSLWTTMTYRML